ncbi:protein of unknown function [Cnuella takakiae]|uniref:DUF1543 domain-containing protein n=1 Tax=Cnuella takakiae TaxID=1302690 RepID=A0A1M5CYM0_9BACT|nr:DUF1543 domain-containing protein [Cnuella takakiae]SHF59816.1 protein of unknown function [Cnuella takakiae]
MPRLFMLLAGATPPGRHTEQHDVFFGIAETAADLVPGLRAFWPDAGKGLHVDAWRAVTVVNGYRVEVQEGAVDTGMHRLFFINLGGYKKDQFDEFHYKMIVAAPDKAAAVLAAKQTAFFRHTGFKGAPAHIDDKYGVDVDDVYAIADILPPSVKDRYRLVLTPAETELPEDEIHLGYFRLDRAEQWGK